MHTDLSAVAGTSSFDADADVEPVRHGGDDDDDAAADGDGGGSSLLLDSLRQKLPDLFLNPPAEEVHDLSATAGTSSSSAAAAYDAAELPVAVGHEGDGCDDEDVTSSRRRCSRGWYQLTAPSSGRWTAAAG
jgi:hypothetical protein